MSTCTTRPVTEIDAQSGEAARDAATRDEFARIAAQRIFVGPRGGLVVAWRRERPASVRLPSEADVEALRFCVDIDCESELPVLSAGLVAGTVLFPGDILRLPLKHHGIFQGTAALPDSVRLQLQPQGAPELCSSWFERDGVLDQRISLLEAELGRYVGGVEALDCAGQWQSRDGLSALWSWLRRRWLPVAVLDISACNLEGDGAALLAEQVAERPWLRRLSLAENGLTNQDAAGILGSTCEQRQHRLYVDLAYNAVNSTSQLGPRSDITLNIGPAWSRAEAEHALSG